MSNVRPDFLIVGGGIGGAVLAHLLTRAGRRCVVIEREASAAKPRLAVPRPEVLWPATAAVLSDLVPTGAWGEAATPVRGMTFSRAGRTLLSVRVKAAARRAANPADPRSAGAWLTDPAATRRLLLENADFEVRHGLTVGGLVWDGGRVAGVRARAGAGAGNAQAEQVLEAAHVIGDDGARSAVREACGIPLRPRSLPVDLLCFEADAPGAGKPLAEPALARVWINPHWGGSGMFLLIAVALPGGRAVGMVSARPWLLDDAGATARAWRALLESSPGAAEVRPGLRLPGDAVRVRMSYGNADRYGVPGAFLIGDAAHPVTPAGGQGANLAVADAMSLARALCSGVPESEVLEAYERERRPAVRRSIRLSRGAALGLSLPDRLLGALAPAVLGLVGRGDPGWLGRLLAVPATAFQTRPPRCRVGRMGRLNRPAWAGGGWC